MCVLGKKDKQRRPYHIPSRDNPTEIRPPADRHDTMHRGVDQHRPAIDREVVEDGHPQGDISERKTDSPQCAVNVTFT